MAIYRENKKKTMNDKNLQRKAYDLYTDAKEVIDNLIEKIDNLEDDMNILNTEIEKMSDRIIELEDHILNLEKKRIMLTENEKQKLIKDAAAIFVAAGGILTLAFAIYFIVDTLKKWY